MTLCLFGVDLANITNSRLILMLTLLTILTNCNLTHEISDYSFSRRMAEATAAQIESILSEVISAEQSTSSVVATSISTFPKIVHPIEEPQLSQHDLASLQIALNSQKVSEISKAILGVECLVADLKKSFGLVRTSSYSVLSAAQKVEIE